MLIPTIVKQVSMISLLSISLSSPLSVANQFNPKLSMQAKMPVTALQMKQQIQPLTAKLKMSSKRQGSVPLKGISWQCKSSTCMANTAWPKNPVAACTLLAKQVGQVTAFFQASHRLNKTELQQCNHVLKTAQPSVVNQLSSSLARSVAVPKQPLQQNNQLQTKPSSTVGMAGTQLPGQAALPRMPTGRIAQLPAANSPPSMSGGARDDRPSNQDAVNAVREHAARRASSGSISSIVANERGYSCVRDSGDRYAQFVINGSRFGSTAAGRKIVLATPVRHTVVAQARIISWSDTRIVAQLPYGDRDINDGQRYVVGIQDASNRWVSNVTRELYVCPAKVVVSGQVNLQHCSAGLPNVKVGVSIDGRAQRDISMQPVPGNDFIMQYRAEYNAQPSMAIQLTPRLVGVSCPGGVWTPANTRMTLGHSRSIGRQDFSYQVSLQRFSVPMSALARLVQDAFRGTTMRINNYDTATRDRRASDTRLRLSDALGGMERTYDILPVKQGPRSYFIQDINMENIAVRPTATGLKVTLAFEERGVEFKGHCRPTNPGERISCVLGAPDVQARLSVDVFMTLDRYYSRSAPLSISFSDLRVEAHPNAQASGICEAIDVCNLFTNYKRQIKNAIENNLTAALDTREVRDNVANAMASTLRSLRIGRVNGVSVEGSQFVITYLPAE